MAWKTSFNPVVALLAVSWITRTYGILKTVPNNVVAKLEDRVEFECSTNETVPDSRDVSSVGAEAASPLDWTFHSATSSTENSIYKSGYLTHNISSKYAIISDNTRGRYNLVINSVDLSFAGTYACIEPHLGDKVPHIVSAELIVIATDPFCGSNASKVITEGDYISMWCTVNYSGNWILTMEWTSNNVQYAHADIHNANTSTSVSSMLTTQLNSTDSEVTFTCKTSFKPMTTHNRSTLQGVVRATNVPRYQHLWNFTATNLHESGRSQSQHNPPLYAEVQRNSNGCQVVEDHRMPVYASVKKERMVEHVPTVSNNHQQTQSIPVYAEVNKMDNGKMILEPSSQTLLPTSTESRQNYVGADGTQYMVLDSLTELKSNGVNVKHPPLFSVVETYASIDHTMTAPPPPPRLAPRRH